MLSGWANPPRRFACKQYQLDTKAEQGRGGWPYHRAEGPLREEASKGERGEVYQSSMMQSALLSR